MCTCICGLSPHMKDKHLSEDLNYIMIGFIISTFHLIVSGKRSDMLG